MLLKHYQTHTTTSLDMYTKIRVHICRIRAHICRTVKQSRLHVGTDTEGRWGTVDTDEKHLGGMCGVSVNLARNADTIETQKENRIRKLS